MVAAVVGADAGYLEGCNGVEHWVEVQGLPELGISEEGAPFFADLADCEAGYGVEVQEDWAEFLVIQEINRGFWTAGWGGWANWFGKDGGAGEG